MPIESRMWTVVLFAALLAGACSGTPSPPAEPEASGSPAAREAVPVPGEPAAGEAPRPAPAGDPAGALASEPAPAIEPVPAAEPGPAIEPEPEPEPAPIDQPPTAAPAEPEPTPPSEIAPTVADPGGTVEVTMTVPGSTRIGAAKCKVCHKVQYASWSESPHARREPPLDCESCHGPGSEYKSMTVMKDAEKATAAGLVRPGPEFCSNCHTGEVSADMLTRAHAHKEQS